MFQPPHCPFYLFCRGNRRKIPYKQGTLLGALTGEVIREWNESSESIRPSEYTVGVKTKGKESSLVKTRKASGSKKTESSNDKCPLTLEARASQGDHEGMALIPQDYVKRGICAPYDWHSSEIFLYILDESRTT